MAALPFPHELSGVNAVNIEMNLLREELAACKAECALWLTDVRDHWEPENTQLKGWLEDCDEELAKLREEVARLKWEIETGDFEDSDAGGDKLVYGARWNREREEGYEKSDEANAQMDEEEDEEDEGQGAWKNMNSIHRVRS